MYGVAAVGRGLRGKGVRLGSGGIHLLVRSSMIFAVSGSSCSIMVYLRRILEGVMAVSWVYCRRVGILPSWIFVR